MTKAKHRIDYRTMLEFISSKCIEPLFQHNSPAYRISPLIVRLQVNQPINDFHLLSQ